MPVIPGSSMPQVMSAGSPVPIASASRAATEAGAVKDFGDALTRVGQQLGESIKQSHLQKQRLDLAEASNAFNEQLLMKQMQQNAAAPMPDDPDGTKTFTSFREQLQDPMLTISEQLADPETRRAFEIQAQKSLQDTQLHIYASEAKKRINANAEQFDRVTNQLSNGARTNLGSLEEALVKSEALIRGDGALAPALKSDMVANSAKAIISGAYNGAIERGEFNTATALLDTHAIHFTPVEMDKFKDAAFNEEYRRHTRAMQEEARQAAADVRETKKAEKAAVSQYLSVLQSGSAEEVLAANNVLQMKVDAGIVDGNRARLAMSSPQAKQKLNTAFTSSMAQQMLTGRMTPEEAEEMITSAPVGEMKLQDQMQLTAGVGKLSQAIQNDPSFAQRVRAGAQKIEALRDLPFTGPQSAANTAANNRLVQGMLNQYYSGLVMNYNPNQEPTALADYVMQRQGYTYAPKNPGDIRKQQEEILEQEQVRKASGMSTSATQKATIDKLRQLQLQLVNVEQKDGK